MTHLVRMSQEVFPRFFERAVSNYAADNVAAGRWSPEDAADLARSETERLLSQGVATPDHWVYEVRDEAGTVGFIWFTTMSRGTKRLAYVLQLHTEPEFRQRGHARAALTAAEALAADMGLESIALHVFSHNQAALGLYRSLGYEVSSLSLAKPLPSKS
jgi:ribosomal protein S18 acetylase RimI-like enzyme